MIASAIQNRHMGTLLTTSQVSTPLSLSQGFTTHSTPHQATNKLTMGNLLTSYAQSALDSMNNYWSRPSRILLLGLDGAGKTTLLYKLKLGEAITTIPTIGFNVETFKYKNIEFTAWDIGGQSKLRSLWRFYFQGCDAIVYVVDSTDRDRIDEAALELQRVFQHEELRDAKLLVYANKQDQPGCVSAQELQHKLNLTAVTRNPTHVQKATAITGEGVYEGLAWLSKAITGK